MSHIAELLTLLYRAKVDFVLIGGAAAIAHGSASSTQDVDIVAPFSVENLTRLLNALAPHQPRYALVPGHPLVDRSVEQLSQFRNLYLLTALGRLDVLGEVPPVGDFARVASKAMEIDFCGFPCRVIDLNDLIRVKESIHRPKDQLVVRELRAIRSKLGQ